MAYGISPTSKRRNHLTQLTPCTPGTTRRSGKPFSGRNISPFMPQATMASFSTSSKLTVRVMPEPSPPSAKRYLPFLRSAPHSSKSTDKGTPVNSQQESMPWVYCTVGTATLPHSKPVFAPHSMKWMRDTDGRRIKSFIVKTRLCLTKPFTIKRCISGSMLYQP